MPQEEEHHLNLSVCVASQFLQRYAIAGGRGKTATLGEFVEVGVLLYPSEYCPSYKLLLSRRYLADDDPRAAMTAKDMLKQLEGHHDNLMRQDLYDDADLYEEEPDPPDPMRFVEIMHNFVPRMGTRRP